MNLRILTPNDASWVAPLIRPMYPGLVPDDQILTILTAGTTPSLTFGDPAVISPFGTGIIGRLDHYRLPTNFTVPALANKLATQVTLLAPLPIYEVGGKQFILDNMVPLLAHVLHQIALQYPVVANRPVWGFVDQKVIDILVQFSPTLNTLAVSNGYGYVWHTKLSDADNSLVGVRP